MAHENCEHGLPWVYCNLHSWSRLVPSEPTKSIRIQSKEERVITQLRQVLRESPALLSHLHWAGDTMGLSTVTLLYAQIGVLNYQLSIIASATGGRKTSVSLTFRMPRGRWFQISRYRVVLSPLQSRSTAVPPPPSPLLLRPLRPPLPPRNREVA